MNQDLFQAGNHLTLNGQEYLIVKNLPGNKILIESLGFHGKNMKTLAYKLNWNQAVDNIPSPHSVSLIVSPNEKALFPLIDAYQMDIFVIDDNNSFHRPILFIASDVPSRSVLVSGLLWEEKE